MAKERVDSMLVARGLCDSREQAKRLIMAGEVFTESDRVAKPRPVPYTHLTLPTVYPG